MENIYFTDERYPDNVIHIDQLKQEYGQHIVDGAIDPTEKTFEQYVNCCLSCNGGTLTAIKEGDEPRPYTVFVRETYANHVTVNARCFDDAIKELETRYCNGHLNLDDYFTGVEFMPCCQECDSEVESVDDLRQAPDGRYLCKDCWFRLTLD